MSYRFIYYSIFFEINFYFRGRVILGGIFMRHYDILFDRGSQKIHFTRSNCSDEYKGPYFNDNIDFNNGDQKSKFLIKT